MKYLIILLALASCYNPRTLESRNCIYNSWQDGKSHCSRYRTVAADNRRVPPQRYYYR
ncbi:MAG: hypothetical protein KA100_04780 [Rickettsiales bacterium]|nr:hypothetical protein [Rickettsiales bacterium]